MFTEKDYLGVRPLQVFDEFVALQEFVGALGRVCGVSAVGGRSRRDSWGIFSGRRWVGHGPVCRH